MVHIRTKEIYASYNLTVDTIVNKWLAENQITSEQLIDIKYHTQLTDNNSESSVLIIYKTS
jgi:hypothetical protein